MLNQFNTRNHKGQTGQAGQGLVEYSIIIVGLIIVAAIVAAIVLPLLADTAIMEGIKIFTDLV